MPAAEVVAEVAPEVTAGSEEELVMLISLFSKNDCPVCNDTPGSNRDSILDILLHALKRHKISALMQKCILKTCLGVDQIESKY